MQSKSIIWESFQEKPLKVDRERGIVHDVLICGRTSKNNRVYLETAFSPEVYEGKTVFENHATERKVGDGIGTIKNVRIIKGLPYGDFHLMKSHRLYEYIMECSENNVPMFGLSHHANCQLRSDRKSGQTIVEKVVECQSVDLVANPGTTRTVYESKQMPTTLKTLAESVQSNNKFTPRQRKSLKWLAEADEMGMADVGVDPLPDDMLAGDTVTSAFEMAATELAQQLMAGTLDIKDFVKKIKAVKTAHEQVSGDMASEPVDAMEMPDLEDDEMDEEDYMESVQIAAKHNLITESQAADLDLIAGTPRGKRQKLIKRLTESKQSSGTPVSPPMWKPRPTEKKTETTSIRESILSKYRD